MVIDTSALAAILFNEPDAESFEAKIADAPTRAISTATLLESAIVAEARLGPEGGRELDLIMYKSSVDIVPFDGEQLALARSAFRHYGKGRHPAVLNFGDCFAYALSRTRGEPLLCKGTDFAATDITVA
jgi:ribonuclease VapC